MNDITIVRGDTLQLALREIKMSDGSEYTLKDTDIIYLDVKKNPIDKIAVFRKSVTSADYIDDVLPVTILPEDTVGLSPGDYYFDVRLFMDDENIYTIIPMSKFRIVRNVTDIPEKGGG